MYDDPDDPEEDRRVVQHVSELKLDLSSIWDDIERLPYEPGESPIEEKRARS